MPRAPRIELRRLDVAAGLVPHGGGEALAAGLLKPKQDPGAAARARERLQELLELLLRRSAPEGCRGPSQTLEGASRDGKASEGGREDGNAEGEQAPLWGLRCAREGELHELVCEALRVNQKYLQGVRVLRAKLQCTCGCLSAGLWLCWARYTCFRRRGTMS